MTLSEYAAGPPLKSFSSELPPYEAMITTLEDTTMIKKSEAINELAAALSKAQAAMEGATKDSENPHFKAKYADLGNCWVACRKALTDNGLGIIQIPSADGANVTVTTMLTHSSGQFIEGSLSMIAQKNTPQGVGSCITYARRYALSAFVGIAPEDDDGQAASQGGGNYQKPPASVLSEPQLKRMFALMNQSTWDQAKLKAVLLEKFGLDSSRKLNRQQYDQVCDALQANPKPKEDATIEKLKEDGQLKTGTEVANAE